jgi:hypothetical protein
MLFEDRLGMDLYTPIGMEWFTEGYWAINNQEDTAKQFLDLEQAYEPEDGTPILNMVAAGNMVEGQFLVADPGFTSAHKACTLDYFINNRFDYVIASIPAHVDIFKKLIAQYQPHAKLIVQMGNNWNLANYAGYNVLASIAPQPGGGSNTMFYHQEFDLKFFDPKPITASRKIYSFLNIIQASGIGWQDYQQLRRLLSGDGFEFKAYGGQCPDGNMTGPLELAEKMNEAQFIFHVKPGGDGFGHIIHNAYALGRPVITRPSHYRGQLAEQLLVPGTFIDLDRYGPAEVMNIVLRLSEDPVGLTRMSKLAYAKFREIVNYENEALEINKWLTELV